MKRSYDKALQSSVEEYFEVVKGLEQVKQSNDSIQIKTIKGETRKVPITKFKNKQYLMDKTRGNGILIYAKNQRKYAGIDG